MREKIAQTLGLSIAQINIKATTPEGLGALGRREGIAVWAIALLTSPVPSP
jgi:2-C-methyl-D-erythritol 2,4-cyclodiphosphate synthase